MTAVLALAGALLYGLSDFVGGYVSRRTSAWAVALVGSLAGGLFILVAALVVGGSPDRSDLLWGLLGGVGNGFGTAFLYRGLAGGRMGVVAPISGVGAAVVPVVVGLLSGERPGPLVWVGILAALPGIWLVSRQPETAVSPAASGVGDGVLAGLGFGTLFAALGQIPESAGLLPLALAQALGAVVIVVVATGMRVPWVPRDPRVLVGAVCGALGGAATLCFLLATHRGDLTVAAILASLYPAFTILLAATVLREPIHRSQGLGLLLCGMAVALVAVG